MVAGGGRRRGLKPEKKQGYCIDAVEGFGFSRCRHGSQIILKKGSVLNDRLRRLSDPPYNKLLLLSCVADCIGQLIAACLPSRLSLLRISLFPPGKGTRSYALTESTYSCRFLIKKFTARCSGRTGVGSRRMPCVMNRVFVLPAVVGMSRPRRTSNITCWGARCRSRRTTLI